MYKSQQKTICISLRCFRQPNGYENINAFPRLDQIEEQYFELPEHIVADAGYGSEPNYDDILSKRN